MASAEFANRFFQGFQGFRGGQEAAGRSGRKRRRTWAWQRRQKAAYRCLDLAMIALHSVKMSNQNSSHTRLSDKGRAQLDERRSRQAQALRDNLRKRKAQVRERSDSPAGSAAGGGDAPDRGNGEP